MGFGHLADMLRLKLRWAVTVSPGLGLKFVKRVGHVEVALLEGVFFVKEVLMLGRFVLGGSLERSLVVGWELGLLVERAVLLVH